MICPELEEFGTCIHSDHMNGKETTMSDDYMDEWTKTRNIQQSIAGPTHAAITRHWSLIHNKDIPVMTPRELVEQYPVRDLIPRASNGALKVDDWDGIQNFQCAVMLETQLLIIDNMPGADDSWADYIPDGTWQLANLATGYDEWDYYNFILNNIHLFGLADPPEMEDEYEELIPQWLESHGYMPVFLQDCTSILLYATAEDRSAPHRVEILMPS